ncbi:hypothetical protein EMIT079MI2_520004 [Bacillus sp. IT-79MI2]
MNGVQALSNVAAPVLGGMLYSIVGLKTLVVISCIIFQFVLLSKLRTYYRLTIQSLLRKIKS